MCAVKCAIPPAPECSESRLYVTSVECFRAGLCLRYTIEYEMDAAGNSNPDPLIRKPECSPSNQQVVGSSPTFGSTPFPPATDVPVRAISLPVSFGIQRA